MAPKSNLCNKKVTDFFKPHGTTVNHEHTESITSTPNLSNQLSPSHIPATLPYGISHQVCPVSRSARLSSSPSSPQASAKPRVIPSSDGEDSADDSDLDDPFALLSTLQFMSKPSLKSKWNRETVDTLTVPPEPEPAVYKFSLQKLLSDRNKANALENDIKRARNLLDVCANKRYSLGDALSIFTEDTADAIMGHRGSGARLLEALDRKEAWRMDETWSFFDHGVGPINKNERPFPSSVVICHTTFAAIEDVSLREHMFLSGVFTDMSAIGEILPDEVLIWMLDHICLDPNEHLAFAYLRMLEAHLLKRHNILTISKVTSLLKLLGAKNNALDLDRQLQLNRKCSAAVAYPVKGIGFTLDPVRYTNLPIGYNNWNLKLFLKLMGETINIEQSAARFVCGILIRIALDDGISQQSDIVMSIERSLYTIWCNIPDGEWDEQSQAIGYSVMSTILQPQLRIRVLRILPISSPRLHLFRRRLACAFLFEDGMYLAKSHQGLVHLSKFANLLREHQYRIHKGTNYATLQSLISILDIAIDNGATMGTTAEKDTGIDQLINILRVMFSKIVDTNAQNLARTEAKDTIERLQFRLTFSVRSRQKMALDMDSGGSQNVLNWNRQFSTIVSTTS